MRAEPRGLGAEGSFMRVVGLLTHELGHRHRGRSLRPILPFRDAKIEINRCCAVLKFGFRTKYRIAKYRSRRILSRKVSNAKNIENTKYRIAQYQPRKISTDKLLSAKYRGAKYRTHNIEVEKYRTQIIEGEKYRKGKISKDKYPSGMISKDKI